MYPDPDDAEGIAAARSICVACPVRAECMQWALSLSVLEDPGGVLGGLTEEQRQGRIERKTCTGCGETLPLSRFGLHWRQDRGRAYHRSRCNGCRRDEERIRHERRKAASLTA